VKLNPRTLGQHALSYKGVFGAPFEEFAALGELRNKDDPDKHHIFIDQGAKILAVAHLDSVQPYNGVHIQGQTMHCATLDDRLGAFVILVVLPKLGLNVDILLTDNEEYGASTGRYFETDKQYNWIVQFDRMDLDVAMYQYRTDELDELVRAVGMRPVDGSFTCISDMDKLGCSAFNWGVCYQNYHFASAHVNLKDLALSLRRFRRFFKDNCDTVMPYTYTTPKYKGYWDTWKAGEYSDYPKTTRNWGDYYDSALYGWSKDPETGAWVYSSKAKKDAVTTDIDLGSCETCQRRPATAMVRELQDGGVTLYYNLCATCIRELGYAAKDIELVTTKHAAIGPWCDACEQDRAVATVQSDSGQDYNLCRACQVLLGYATDYTSTEGVAALPSRNDLEVATPITPSLHCDWCAAPADLMVYDQPSKIDIPLCYGCHRWWAQELRYG